MKQIFVRITRSIMIIKLYVCWLVGILIHVRDSMSFAQSVITKIVLHANAANIKVFAGQKHVMVFPLYFKSTYAKQSETGPFQCDGKDLFCLSSFINLKTKVFLPYFFFFIFNLSFSVRFFSTYLAVVRLSLAEYKRKHTKLVNVDNQKK